MSTESDKVSETTWGCPAPLSTNDTIQLAHGGGGMMTHRLIEQVFVPAFDNPWLRSMHDGAELPLDASRLVFTTDSYVVHPVFFPGGDIGKLAVCGTINDICMCGARPLYLSAGFIIEEGFPIADLKKITTSMQEAAESAQVHLVTGDTKVVDRGKGDGIYINTAGIGIPVSDQTVAPNRIQPGDAIIVSGDIGRHGIAIMTSREGLTLQEPIESDCGSLADPVMALMNEGLNIHCMRDLTRGGLATCLVELSRSCGYHFTIKEASIPIISPVNGVCEILGLDPFYVANEGRCVVLTPEAEAEKVLHIMKSYDISSDAVIIGNVTSEKDKTVTLERNIGSHYILDLLSGEQLPRIC